MTSTGPWAYADSEETLQQALRLARGDYQRNIILGYEALSGSTLTGKAKQYGASYDRSRGAILNRLTEAGIPWRVEIGQHQRKILVLGLPPCPECGRPQERPIHRCQLFPEIIR